MSLTLNQKPNFIEITCSDGTVARWACGDDEKIDIISSYIELMIGPPETMVL